MRSSSRSRLRRSCWAVTPSGGSCGWPAGGWGTCSRICPSSRATTSASAVLPIRSAWSSSSSPAARRRSVTACDCWIPPRFPVVNPARHANARSWPAGLPTGIAPVIPATSGVSGCICFAPRTGCRSASAWRRPTRASVRSPRRCSPAPANADCSQVVRSSSPIKASPAPSSSKPSRIWTRPSSGPTARTRSPGSGSSAASVSGSNRSIRPPRANSRSKTTADISPQGVWTRVCQRVLALAAGVWHSWQLWETGLTDTPGRHFTNYDH